MIRAGRSWGLVGAYHAPVPTVPSVRRSLLLATAVGLGLGLCVVAIVVAIVAIPLFALARATEPSGGVGLDRPVIRDNLIHVALPAGVVVGVVAGAVVGRWYRRGGRLPTPTE